MRKRIVYNKETKEIGTLIEFNIYFRKQREWDFVIEYDDRIVESRLKDDIDKPAHFKKHFEILTY